MFQKPQSDKIRQRRRSKARKKRQALRIYHHDLLAKWADHLKGCSCDMCGNPRRRFGQKSLQEIRADIREYASLQELSE